MNNYIYLLKEREFIKTNENIYKVGKTTQDNDNRIKQYPKGSKLLLLCDCINNCSQIEHTIIQLFKSKYIQRKDIGNEYFEGDYKSMMNDIFTSIFNNATFNNTAYISNTSNIDDMILSALKRRSSKL